ncbi:MAG TPA: DUF433 domain-containing protein [Jatrophihabitans sp.]
MDELVFTTRCGDACGRCGSSRLALDLTGGIGRGPYCPGSAPNARVDAEDLCLREVSPRGIRRRVCVGEPKLVSDGIDVFFERDDELERLLDRQMAAREVVEPYLVELVPWADDLTGAYRPPLLKSDLIEIDPRFNSGRMSFRRNRVPILSVVGSLLADETIAEVAEGYGLTHDEAALVDRNREWLATAA